MTNPNRIYLFIVPLPRPTAFPSGGSLFRISFSLINTKKIDSNQNNYHERKSLQPVFNIIDVSCNEKYNPTSIGTINYPSSPF